MTRTKTYSHFTPQFFGQTLIAVFFVVTVLGLAIPDSHAQSLQNQTTIYRDFTYVMRNNSRDWRVTDPGAGAPGSKRFLPNPTMQIQVGDLEGAIRAEAIIDLWGGHPGTTNKQLRFNRNAWIDIPEINTTPVGIKPECFVHQWNPVVDIPLEYLREGTNTFEGLSGPQVCRGSNFGWGQWGWYGITVRVYYDPAVRTYPAGQVISPVANATIGEDPVIMVSASGAIPIARVDVIAYYDGADENGDGVHADWHTAYVSSLSQNSMPLSEHVGTDTKAPYTVTWDTHWIPDQPTQGIQFKALITDTSGMVFETRPVSGISLQRDDVTVKHYSAEDVPEAFWVRANQTKVSKFTIPTSDDLSNATEVRGHIRTWNGIKQDALINGVAVPVGGANHEFRYTKPSFPVSTLQTGQNMVSFHNPTKHHGTEIAWPGPGITVRYKGSSEPPEPTITIASPINGASIDDDQITLMVNRTGGDHWHALLDTLNVQVDQNQNSYTFTNVSAGSHVLGAYVADANQTLLAQADLVDVTVSAVPHQAECGDIVCEPGENCPEECDLGASGLVGYWAFDEGSGNTTADNSGSGHTGTLQGPSWTSGRNDGGLSFDRNGDYVSTGRWSVTGNQITLAAWVKPSSIGGDPRVIAKASGTASSEQTWMLDIDDGANNNVSFRVNTGGSAKRLTAGSSIPTNQWTHIAGVYNGSNMIIYQNGVAVGQTLKSGNLLVNSHPVQFGDNAGGSRPFNGVLDDVYIYSRALTASEIATLAER